MSTFLTGIKPTGIPHLGNIKGAIEPAIFRQDWYDLVKTDSEGLFEFVPKDSAAKAVETKPAPGVFFIANLHSLTTPEIIPELRQFSWNVAASWLACGLKVPQNILFRQSDVPEVCELTWYLNCFASHGTLKRATSYKDKMAKGLDVNNGLFTYPVLMAADILLYDSDYVPVGRDQLQHLEMTREFAYRFNYQLQSEVLKIPQAVITHDLNVLPGIDGRKMSKSYQNSITPFCTDKELKNVVMKIVTNSQGIEEAKNPAESSIFAIYECLASQEQTEILRGRYLAGGMGWGHAKQALLELIMEKYAEPRKVYFELMKDPAQIEGILQKGASQARAKASEVLERVRTALKF